MKTKALQIPKIKKFPYFKKGSLVFEKSDHRLRVSDRHYRCDLDCRGNCQEKEKQFKKESLERTFSRYAKKFSIDPIIATKLYQKLMMFEFMKIMFLADEKAESHNEFIHSTLTVMEQETTTKGRTRKSDIKDFEDGYVAQQKATGIAMLFGYLIGVLKVFAHPENERALGQSLAFITKDIYLTDTGKISKIQLEDWGWYMLNYLNRHIPNYLLGLKNNGVIITNPREQFLDLELYEAIKHFYKEGMIDVSNKNIGNEHYHLLKFLQSMTKNMMTGDTQKMSQNLVELFRNISGDKQTELVIKLFPIIKG